MRSRSFTLLTVFVVAAGTTLVRADSTNDGAADRPGTIVIDGEFDDWKRIPVSAEYSNFEGREGLTLRSLRVSHGPSAVFLMVELSAPVLLQWMSDAGGAIGRLTILFDADGRPETGWSEFEMKGVDLAIDFPPRGVENGTRVGGIAARLGDGTPGDQPRTRSSYHVGLFSAPTHASERFEIRLLRGPSPLFTNENLRCKVCLLDDDSAAVTHVLGPVSHGMKRSVGTDVTSTTSEPLSRTQPGVTRVIVWNTGLTRLLDAEARPSYERVFTALDPDIVFLDEVLGESPLVDAKRLTRAVGRPVARVEDWIDLSHGIHALVRQVLSRSTRSRADDWHVAVSEHGAIETTLVAARMPLDRVTQLDRVFPMPLDGHSSSVGAIARVGNHRILTVPVDFVSRGKAPGDENDRGRLAQASAIRQAVEKAVAEHKVDGVVIGGDLNLVGSRAPLDHLLRTPLFGIEEMKVVSALRLDGASNATWPSNHRTEPGFGPGRLDYVLYSGPKLRVEKAFVFQSNELGERWLKHYGLNENDSEMCSDHLPIVVDFSLAESD